VSQRLSACVAVAGILSVAFAVALGAHTVLSLGQSAGLLGGDYSSHNHQGLFPVALAGVTVALGAIFLYVVHLAGAGGSSLPSLARELGRQIGWRSVALTALAACLVLAGMEAGEQLAAGRFDGLFSAFGSSPIAGLGLILLLSAAGNALLQNVCRWLAGAHAQIVLAIAYLLSRREIGANPCRARSKRVALTVFRYACDIPQALGKRGPPILVR
jgi:hypothetical protein